LAVRRVLTRAGRTGAGVAALLVGGAARSWVRNVRTATPAIGSMSLVLLLTGTLALSWLSVSSVLRKVANEASVVHLYLRSGAPNEDVDALIHQLQSNPRVASVSYVSSAEALRDARGRPGLSQLIDDSATNPFPGSLDVEAVTLADVGQIASSMTAQSVLDPTGPTSYDVGAYQSLTRFIEVAGAIAAAVVLGIAAVSVVITGNAMRASVLARQDEVAIMRLLGAGGWLVLGPFLVEGWITGEVAGALGAGTLLALFAGARNASAQLFTSLLPGVDWATCTFCAAGLVVAGGVLGATASVAGLWGVRE
jgi:cell division transport system permease protein